MKRKNLLVEMETLLTKADDKSKALGDMVTSAFLSGGHVTEDAFQEASLLKEEIKHLRQSWMDRYELAYNGGPAE